MRGIVPAEDGARLEPLRSVAGDPHASAREIRQAVALALWHGATGQEINDTVGHWPRVPEIVEDGDPVWHWLP